MVSSRVLDAFTYFMDAVDKAVQEHPGLSVLAVSRALKGMAFMFLTYISGYIVLNVTMHMITNFCQYKIDMIEYQTKSENRKDKGKPKMRLFSDQYIWKMRIMFYSTAVLISALYIMGLLLEPVGAAIVPKQFNNVSFWVYARGVSAFVTTMINYFWSAASACQFMVEQFGQQVGLATCIGSIVAKAIAVFTAQFSTGQIARLDPPDEFYDAEDWQWNEDYCNGNAAKRGIRQTSMVYDLQLVQPEYKFSPNRRGENYEWWHIGHYQDRSNITKHMYAGGKSGGTYDTYVFGMDLHSPNRFNNKHKREDVPSLVYEFADVPSSDYYDSSLVSEECVSHEITRQISEALAMDPDNPIDGCYGFYDGSGWLGWMYIHLTLADDLEGLNDEDRWEHFGQCYDEAEDHYWG